MRKIYSVRDTATGNDLTHFDAFHAGEALGRLAAVVVGTQRISFELYEIGVIHFTDGVMSVESIPRTYVCSASQAMLDSFMEEASDLIDGETPDAESKPA